MAIFWSTSKILAADLPFKIQMQTIKNNGKNPIYLFPIEDDEPVHRTLLLAYSLAVVNPGDTYDLTISPYFSLSQSYSNPDYEVCIHSDGDIDIDVESSDICNRWQSDPSHPWNGTLLHNGQYTNKYKTTHTVNAINAALLTSLNSFLVQALEMVPFSFTIAMPPECTCGEKGNRHPGKCSHWCDLELDKNKQIL